MLVGALGGVNYKRDLKESKNLIFQCKVLLLVNVQSYVFQVASNLQPMPVALYRSNW